jgi:hypothetical protein
MTNHDRLFKELLQTFFVEFLELLFPKVAAYIDAGNIEFLGVPAPPGDAETEPGDTAVDLGIRRSLP